MCSIKGLCGKKGVRGKKGVCSKKGLCCKKGVRGKKGGCSIWHIYGTYIAVTVPQFPSEHFKVYLDTRCSEFHMKRDTEMVFITRLDENLWVNVFKYMYALRLQFKNFLQST